MDLAEGRAYLKALWQMGDGKYKKLSTRKVYGDRLERGGGS